MITNTLEWKAKFFALYWGQKILKYNEVDNSVSFNIGILITNSVKDAFIELRPLSSITDEEAIEVAKIVLEEPFNRYRRIEVTRNYAVTGWPYIMIHHNQCRYKLQIDCTLVNFDIIDMDGTVANEFDMKPTDCVDYLRSRRFALPFMGVSVETLIEWGWLKIS